MARTPPFEGIMAYFPAFEYYNPNRLLGGKMPLFFGTQRNIPVMVEGNCYFRFFKIAFFDQIVPQMPILALADPKKVVLPPVTLEYQLIASDSNYLNRMVKKIHGNEKCLMSRAVDEFPINRFFFPGETDVRPQPQQTGATIRSGDKIFPALDSRLVTWQFDSGKQFISERVRTDAQDRRVLDIDGWMSVDNGDLDLTGIETFRGRGVIVVSHGNVKIGSLQRLVPSSNDLLKIYVWNGNIAVGGKAPVKIEASLIATSMDSPNPEGMFFANGNNVEIKGNLVLDYLPIADSAGNGLGGKLEIVHDTQLFAPSDPYRVSIGTVRTMYSVNSGKPSW